jgi:uncharacterized paraquat-inducible protein A
MPEASFACPKCKTAFQVEPGTTDLAADCPTCRSRLQAFFFPAFFRLRTQEAAPLALGNVSEASCFYHPQKQAVRICDGCGRLICSLCSIDMGTEHLCPNCISAGTKKGTLTTLEGSRVRYDVIAIALAVLALPLSILSVILSPAAIYLSIRHWNSPTSLVKGGRNRVGFTIAIVIAVLALVLWGSIFGLAFFGSGRVHPHHHA